MIPDIALALSPSMVKAIQEGRKLAHREAVSPQPINDRVFMANAAYCGQPHTWLVDGLVSEYHSTGRDVPQWACPYGKAGDVLAVQEPWNKYGGMFSYLADFDWIEDFAKAEPVKYQGLKAKGLDPRWQDADSMPLEYSRLTLQVESVRAELLHKITPDQAVREGICHDKFTRQYWITDSEDHRDKQTRNPCEAYCWLWESQGTPYMWRSNPWVWVIEFSVIEQDVSR